jgi:predicted RND superfamily exporter protein
VARHERAVRAVTDLVVDRPGTIVAVFLLVTAGFALGLGNISTEAGTDQFTQDSPAQAALEDVNREFGPSFGADRGRTQLIQRGQNVLAKPALLRMLRAQKRLSERAGLRVVGTSSAARAVARELDPEAETLPAQIRAVEAATPAAIDAAVRAAADRPGFRSRVSGDFNRRAASASATIGVVTHEVPGGLSAGAGTSGTSPLQRVQTEARHVVGAGPPGGAGAGITVFGSGIVSAEFSSVIADSLVIVVPAAALLILLFLIVAYRDPVDLALGVISLLMAVVWTFGFMGLAGIPFTQMLVAVPPLLLAVGIDFGIHTVNRYREERTGEKAKRGIRPAMDLAVRQLLVAFFIVTGTTVLGFLANTTSSLGPIRDFGVVAAVGITFTFLVFGVFLPAAKVLADRARERVGIPQFGQSPLGQEDSALGAVLPAGVWVARRAPYAFLALCLLATAGAGYYGAGVDTSFSQEDFLPPEETPAYLDRLPEPFEPGEYTVTAQLHFLEERFATAQTSSVTMYVRGPMRQDDALEAIQRAGRDPPDSFATDDRRAQSQSILDVIDAYAAADPAFAALVARNDADDDGVPDDHLGRIYRELLDSPYGDRARQYLAEDFRSAKVVYTAQSDATQGAVTADARELADRYRFSATATGQTVVFQTVSDTIFRSALTSLVTALAATAVFLVFAYWLFEDSPTLGVVNLVPIAVSLALLAATMRFLRVPFNALTATVLAIAIGLGVDYSAHVVHRFADEFDGVDAAAAMERTMRGTGGALTGSVLTTTTGIGVLVLAITPILGQFGLVTALAIFYSYLTSLLVTPAAVVVWRDLRVRWVDRPIGAAAD